MSTRRRFKEQLLDAVGHCEWPGCEFRDLELAHLHGIGVGGRASADKLSNVALLCHYHHALLDGRTHANLRWELALLLTAWVDTQRLFDD